VTDPFGGTAQPTRTISPSGHVAGAISFLDRQRGAHYTPANATLDGALDVTLGYALEVRGALNAAGVDLLRCSPNQGIQIWGGRTLNADPSYRYVAHRRLIHRLVRAIRRVAEPLVFETNGPRLWLAFTRAVTTVLLEAWRGGGLQGDSADQAFRVRCDATNNPPEQIDLGQVVCEIQLAPAVPMEFITLRVVASAAGQLEVFES
jgi:phage tail sheath protein FI